MPTCGSRRRPAAAEHPARPPEGGQSPAEAAQQLERSPNVLYAEPDVPRRAFAVVPDDRYFGRQWSLNNSGQSVAGTAGTVDADIDAPEAWQMTTGSAAVTVAVIDSGVQIDHPDLAAGIWRNPGEAGDRREYNGADDDGNGLVDDWRGWDWVDGDNDPGDANGHGTHVAGTVGARGNDGRGVAGVAWNVSLMPLRTLDADGSGYVSDVIRAYGYAGARKAHVVNASLGGGSFSRAERDAIAAAPQTLFVVAAGNDGADNDTRARVPVQPRARECRLRRGDRPARRAGGLLELRSDDGGPRRAGRQHREHVHRRVVGYALRDLDGHTTRGRRRCPPLVANPGGDGGAGAGCAPRLGRAAARTARPNGHRWSAQRRTGPDEHRSRRRRAGAQRSDSRTSAPIAPAPAPAPSLSPGAGT